MNSKLIEFSRKAIHLSSLIFPVAYRYIIGFQYRTNLFFVLLFFTIMMIAFEIARFKSDRFAKIFHVIFGFALRKHESKRITGATYVLVSFALCILLFPPLIAFWAMAFLSIGDTFAAIIGISFGKIKFPRSSRTLEGSLACLITTFAFAKLTIPASADRNYLLIIILGSITATIAEVLNIRFDDNITIPIFSGIVMTLAYFFL